MPALMPMTLIPGGTVARSVNTGSQRVALGGPSLTTSQGVQQTRQYIVSSDPASANVAFVRFGNVTVTASATTDFPVFPGSYHTFTETATDSAGASAALYIAAICATGSATLYISAGDGA